jgi:glycosyltransferase involved in cell wall biosynthesis
LRICFLVDARSPIAAGWIKHFIDCKHDVHVISSYPCSPDVFPEAKLYQLPIAFSEFARIQHNGAVNSKSKPSLLMSAIAGLRSGRLSRLPTAVRFYLGPIELSRHVKRASDLIHQISPDIVHAMRIPFEGLLAAKATPAEFPLVISVWGNDLTLFASEYSLIGSRTKQALRRADALHCDCLRDLNLAVCSWGFQPQKLGIVLPGSGGIPTNLFHLAEPGLALRDRLNIPDDAPVIINSRGFRSYVRNDIFFQAIPQVLQSYPKAIFICSAMQGNPVAEKWVEQMKIGENVRLLPSVPRREMADLFRLALVAVSPSLHDGTPNTLLEAMACGCIPVAFDIESVREWITHGVNGLLCERTDADSLANAILRSLGDERLREEARRQNSRLIAERAEYNKVMRQAEDFYSEVIQRKQQEIKAY